MVKCLPEFEYFNVFLKNKNIFKIRRSKVTDYAALNTSISYTFHAAFSPCYLKSTAARSTQWFLPTLIGMKIQVKAAS